MLIYDDFKRENDATVRRVLRFLELDDSHPIEALHANETVRMRSQRLDETLHEVALGRGPLARATKATVKALTPQRLRRGALHLTIRHVVRAPPRAPEEELLLELRRRFKGEVVALSEYLDRDLVTLWGYGNLE